MKPSKKIATKLEKSAEELEKLASEYLSGWQRCKADFENYKKREAQRNEEIRRNIGIDSVIEMIPVIDNFDLAIKHIPQKPENEAWIQGFDHIKKQLEIILKNHGIEPIIINEGDKFDPNFHECIEKIPDESRVCDSSKNQKNELLISEVLRNGYTIENKVLRPAQVKVKYFHSK